MRISGLSPGPVQLPSNLPSPWRR